MQLSCPEFTLRGLPRITVRGHPVQGGSVLLRKAPLQSMMIPWSTRRPCGPLAFRRATGKSRQRKMRELRGGIRNHSVSYPPLYAGRRASPRRGYGVLLPGDPGNPRRRAAAMPGLPIGSQSRLQRRTAVSAEINPLLRVKKKERTAASAEGLPSTDGKKKKHRLSPVRSGVTQTPFESGPYRPPWRRRWRAGCCASRRAALRSARCTAAREHRACRSPSRHS